MVYTYGTHILPAIRDLAHAADISLKQERALINRSVREVIAETDLRSMKRRAQLSPSISLHQYQYAKPSDLKGLGIVDIMPQIGRSEGFRGEWVLTTPEEFDRSKRSFRNVMAVYNADGVGKLLVSGVVDSSELTLHDFDSLTGDGTVAAVAGSAANNLTIDRNDYVNGNASVNFDVDTSGTTPAIEVTGFTAVDLTDYEGEQLFAYMKFPTLTGVTITNVILRWGSDNANYYSRTITTNNEGLAFQAGWNLLRFDWDNSISPTGTPDIENIDYARVTITLSAALGTQVTDWNIDFLVARRGLIHDIIYYSRYAWQTSAGVYIENSTADSDLLNVETDEFDLILARVDFNIARSLRNKDDIILSREDYKNKREQYMISSPSEAKTLTTTYYSLGSLADELDVE